MKLRIDSAKGLLINNKEIKDLNIFVKNFGNGIFFKDDEGYTVTLLDDITPNYYINADWVIFNNKWINKDEAKEDLLKLSKYDIKKIFLINSCDFDPISVWNDLKEKNKAKIDFINKNMDYSLENELYNCDYLDDYKGIYVREPYAKMIWEGKKDLIIKPFLFKFGFSKPLYLVDNNYCYGVVKLDRSIKMTPQIFNETRDRHFITNINKMNWWKSGNKNLYGYEFTILNKFDKPIRINNMEETDVFIKKIHFLDNIIIDELIKNVKKYNPKEMSNKQLADDWRIVNAWYSSKKRGKNININYEIIKDLAVKIYNEILIRVKENKMKHTFEPDKMKKYSKELYNYVSQKKEIENKEIHASLKNISSMFSDLKDATLIHNFISAVGSTIKHDIGHKPNDLDILIRMDNPPDYIKRAVQTRVMKMVPENQRDKLHFIWGDPEGAHDSFYPLYHLSLKKVKMPQIIKMSEDEIRPFKLFVPMKSSAEEGHTLFYNVDEAVKYLTPIIEPWIVEHKFDGNHAIIHKEGDKVGIQTEQKHWVTEAFPTLVKEVKQLSGENFIIEGEIVPYSNDGKPLGRAPLLKYIDAVLFNKQGIEDSNIKLHVWDILYYKDKSLTDIQLYERKKVLKTLDFTDHIKLVHPYVARTPNELKEYIIKVSKLPGSEGAMVKRWDSIYTPNKSTNNYIKVKNQATIYVVILKINPVKNDMNTYTVGVYIPNNKINKILPERLTYLNNKPVLLLGKTFATKLKAKKGDILQLSLEQIWRHEQKSTGLMFWSIHKPRVINIINNHSTSSLVDLDKWVVNGGQKIIFTEYYYELTDEEGGTRSEAATKFWTNHWQDMYPVKDGGKFIYHRHWRGLTKDEIDLPEKELWKLDRSVHGDLRCQHDSTTAFGWTVFLGATKDNPYPDDKFIAQNKTHNPKDKLEGHPKLAIPISWLKVGINGPVTASPNTTGATSNKYAKFFAIDYGTYKAGVWREHFFELFFNGRHLKGKLNISYVPVEEGRIWMLDWVENQKPYAQTHDKDKVIEDLKAKHQKWLIWNDPFDNKPSEKIKLI